LGKGKNIAAVGRVSGVHLPYPGQMGTGGNLAIPLTPLEASLGEVCQFCVYKLLQTGDGIFDDGLVALPALAEILHSKNAGPYEITFDIVFRNLTCHERAQKPGKLTKERIAKLYNIKPENVVARQFFRQAEASKCTITRGGIAGSFGG
jgi:Domain of unknown function (DUF4387)